MKITESYNIQIWVGTRVGYSKKIHSIKDVEKICDEFVNEVKACVTITPTQFRYVNGNEPGVVVGIINYPRFPSESEELISKALDLAERLLCGLEQKRVSVTTPNKTYMLEGIHCIEKGDKVVCLETVRNLFGWPLFEKDEIYTVIDVRDDTVILNNISYGNNDFEPQKLDWVITKFKIIK